MNPMEQFVADVFASVSPISSDIGAVHIDPNYVAVPDSLDAHALREELIRCIEAHPLTPDDLDNPQGSRPQITAEYPLLTKYVKEIVLRRKPLGDRWIQVYPPGDF